MLLKPGYEKKNYLSNLILADGTRPESLQAGAAGSVRSFTQPWRECERPVHVRWHSVESWFTLCVCVCVGGWGGFKLGSLTWGTKRAACVRTHTCYGCNVAQAAWGSSYGSCSSHRLHYHLTHWAPNLSPGTPFFPPSTSSFSPSLPLSSFWLYELRCGENRTRWLCVKAHARRASRGSKWKEVGPRKRIYSINLLEFFLVEEVRAQVYAASDTGASSSR